MPPQSQPPRPEHRALQGRPAPGRGLGSQQRTTPRAAPAHARSPGRARPLSKHSGCAPPARPPLPCPRYASRAHLGFCGHPWPAWAWVWRFLLPASRVTAGTTTRAIPEARSVLLGSARSGARPSVCHSLSPAASLANEKSGWRHDGQFLAQGAKRKVGGGS